MSCNHIIIQSFHHHEDASLALWALFLVFCLPNFPNSEGLSTTSWFWRNSFENLFTCSQRKWSFIPSCAWGVRCPKFSPTWYASLWAYWQGAGTFTVPEKWLFDINRAKGGSRQPRCHDDDEGCETGVVSWAGSLRNSERAAFLYIWNYPVSKRVHNQTSKESGNSNSSGYKWADRVKAVHKFSDMVQN